MISDTLGIPGHDDQDDPLARPLEAGREAARRCAFGHRKAQTFFAALRHDGLTAPWAIDGAMTREQFDI